MLLSRLYPVLQLLSSQPECATCRRCEENVGLVYLLKDEVHRATAAGARVVAPFESRGYIARSETGWCQCFDPTSGRCMIYDARPLCCRLYPLDLMKFGHEIWWVIHQDCPIGERFFRERQVDVLAAATIQVERELTPQEIETWLSQDRFSQAVEAFSNDVVNVRRLRRFGSRPSGLAGL